MFITGVMLSLRNILREADAPVARGRAAARQILGD
jgi:hypothetical protein